jgi:3-hydroxyacyl-CoA dehydrogenase
VIEAIVEDLDVKKSLFAKLGGLCKEGTILASNTSSFPIMEMAEASGRADRVVGLHFFNPVQLMRLVEVVRTDATSEDAFASARAFGEAVGKTPVACKDTPGFVVNRLLVPYMTQALLMLERGDASKEDIDAAMQFGCGYPMGPLTLTDYVGLDTTLSILQGWVERYPDEPAFAIPAILEQKVAEGKLGRKTGEGFYKWEGDKKS